MDPQSKREYNKNYYQRKKERADALIAQTVEAKITEQRLQAIESKAILPRLGRLPFNPTIALIFLTSSYLVYEAASTLAQSDGIFLGILKALILESCIVALSFSKTPLYRDRIFKNILLSALVTLSIYSVSGKVVSNYLDLESSFKIHSDKLRVFQTELESVRRLQTAYVARGRLTAAKTLGRNAEKAFALYADAQDNLKIPQNPSSMALHLGYRLAISLANIFLILGVSKRI